MHDFRDFFLHVGVICSRLSLFTGRKPKKTLDIVCIVTTVFVCSSGVREAMTDFWEEHSQDASLEEMMLDTNAAELTKHELPEILSYLPSWEGKDVVELGAGIGYVLF